MPEAPPETSNAINGPLEVSLRLLDGEKRVGAALATEGLDAKINDAPFEVQLPRTCWTPNENRPGERVIEDLRPRFAAKRHPVAAFELEGLGIEDFTLRAKLEAVFGDVQLCPIEAPSLRPPSPETSRS